MSKSKNEIVEVKIGFGYGIEFTIPFLAEIGCSEVLLKEKAITHFKKYMPSKQEVENIEQLLLSRKAYLKVDYELKDLSRS